MEAHRIDAHALGTAIGQLVTSLAEHYGSAENLVIIGIANGGIPLGERLAAGLGKTLGREIPTGSANITFHRDDIRSNPIPGVKERTDLPFPVDGATIILADDVIHTGRTVRAALNEIFDLGRPERVVLAVLCDRGHRSLPVQPDFTGLKLETAATQKVKVSLDSQNPANDTLAVIDG
ncbi:MAG: bifunctional pyr operon transcriptional regulator/uracil phosphoribosyltransferase PyrR [Verrucomicrobiota bacterium]